MSLLARQPLRRRRIAWLVLLTALFALLLTAPTGRGATLEAYTERCKVGTGSDVDCIPDPGPRCPC